MPWQDAPIVQKPSSWKDAPVVKAASSKWQDAPLASSAGSVPKQEKESSLQSIAKTLAAPMEQASQGAARLISNVAALGLSQEDLGKLQKAGLYEPRESPVKEYSQAVYSAILSPLTPLFKKGAEAGKAALKQTGISQPAIDKISDLVGTGMDVLGVAGPGASRGAAAVKKIPVEAPVRDIKVTSNKVLNAPQVAEPTAANAVKPVPETGAASSPFAKKAAAETPFQSKIFSSDQPVASTQVASTQRGLADRLFQQQQSSLADQTELANWLKSNVGNAAPQLGEKFLDYADDPKNTPLTPQEKNLYDATIGTMRQEIEANREEVKGAGLKASNIEEADTLGGAIRQRKGMGTPMDRILGIEQELQGVESGKSLSRSAGTFKGRSLMVLTDKEGKRQVVYIDPEGQIFDAAKKQDTPLGTFDKETEAVKLSNGQDAALHEATRKEIEAATEGRIQYHKNAFGVYTTTLLQTRRAARSVRLLKALKESPEFNQVARAPFVKGETPFDTINGRKVYWREVPGIPGFNGYKFAPRYAEELEDFVHGMGEGMGELSKLDRVNRFTLGLMFFLNPYHAYNVTEMALATKGAGGFLKDLPGTAKDFGESVKDVLLQRKPYMNFARAGISLPGMRMAADRFQRATLSAIGENIKRFPQSWADLAKALADESGVSDPGKLYTRLAEVSHNITFAWQDILQMTLQRGLERKGLSRAKATEEIAKTFPDYRTPSRVLDQRWLGQALQGQAFFDFPKYMYNRFQGAFNMIKGLTGPERMRAIDQLLAVGLMYYAAKTIVDPWLKSMTGNKQAEISDYGYSVYPAAIKNLAEGKRTVGQTIQSFASPGYVVQAADYLRGINPFLARGISVPGETAGQVSMDYLSELAQKLSPVQRMQPVLTGKEKPSDVIWQQLLGVKYPQPLPYSVTKELLARQKYGSKLEQDIRELKKKRNAQQP